jgi:DNA-binding MarR family transcriptional regulator
VDKSQRWRINLLIRTLATRHRTAAAIRLASIGLFPGQETVLLALDRFGPMTQRELVERLGVEPPTLSSMAKKLEVAGYIDRRPSLEDRRAIIVALTPAGQELLPAVRQIGHDLAEVTLDRMDDETVRMLMRAMKRAIGNLSRTPQNG